MKASLALLRGLGGVGLLLGSLATQAATYTITSLGFTPADSNEHWISHVQDINKQRSGSRVWRTV